MEVLILTTPKDPIASNDLPRGVELLNYPGEELNISAWWKYGIDYITAYLPSDEIAVINSDCLISANQLAKLSVALDETNTVMASFDQHSILPGYGYYINRDTSGPIDYRWRIFGSCFLIRPTGWLEVDTQFRWWYSDDDIEFQARRSGGTVLVGGDKIIHPENGGTILSGDLLKWSLEDRERFRRKWGTFPH